ncbi:hypothetical protein A2U01_0119653, partial [Trifolium medium]|nr:hypothetical protein [Trifolium medium]
MKSSEIFIRVCSDSDSTVV